ncbi:MAG: ABC transporter permease [Acidobacteriota bacterium]|nr:ABC transporter permease [Acidobacteriota bacterium]
MSFDDPRAPGRSAHDPLDDGGNVIVSSGAVDARDAAEVAGERLERRHEEQAGDGKRPLTLWSDTWRRLKRNHLALVGLGIIAVFMIVGMIQVVAWVTPKGYLAPYPPNATNYDLSPEGRGSPPSWSHPFGTDYVGRDILSRTLVATRISLLVGVIAVAIALVIGLVLGPISGYYGGWVDSVIMRLADIFFAFPYILFVLLIMVVLGPGFQNVFIAIGILGWATYARLNRGSVLSVKAMEYVEAARAQGASDLRVIFRHVLPNTMAPIYVAIAMGIGGAIVTEAALSYLGIGIQPPDASWGKMISDYLSYFWAGSWWMLTFPSIALTVTVFGFISFGNGLRDATDPKLKE